MSQHVLTQPLSADWVTVEALVSEPEAVADRLRRESPVAFIPDLKGFMLSDFAGIQEAMTVPGNHTVINADRGTTERACGPMLMRREGAEHARQRTQVMRALRPRAVEKEWMRVFTANAEKRLAELIAAGPGANLDEVFSRPFAADNLAAVIGLPWLDFEDVIRWSHAMTAGSANLFDDPEVWKRSDSARSESDAAIEEGIEYLRKHPDGSMLSLMVNAEDPLPREVIKANIKLSISGGVNEPQHTVTNGIWAFTRHLDQLDVAKTLDHGFLAAFDEVVRLYPPIIFTGKRVPDHDVGIRGHAIPAGSALMIFLLAANRDESVFPDAAKFDVGREKRTNMTFGAGAHVCAGQVVARHAVGGVAWPMLYDRLPGLRALAPSVEHEGWVFRRLAELPVTWDA